MAQGRDELGRFVAGLGEASDKLRSMSREVEDSTRAAADRNREERSASLARANAGLSAVGGALGAIGTTGDVADGVASLTRAGIGAVRGFEIAGVQVGNFAAEVAGLNRAERVLGTAAERTLDVTSDIVRYGGEVSDEFRTSTFNTFRDQERRIEEERRKVGSVAFGPENVSNEVGANLGKLLSVAEQILGRLNALGGGAGG